ncbi:MAG: dTDP-4-dehydrorhamnose 3,5-epimerase family protein [Candidatus Levyibacteriota bacterium]
MNVHDLPLYAVDEKNKLADRIYSTAIPGLLYIDSPVHADNRGFYREMALIPDLEKVLGSHFQVKQLNHANSVKNVVRGMHAEDWNKLVTIMHGVCLCVLADIRPDSPTFLKTEYVLLGFGERALPGSLFITRGIANSLCIIQDPVEYIYAVDELYRERDTSGDVAVSIFDPDLNIQWPIPKDEMIISDRDKNSITLRQKYPHKF